jgi:CRISPR-associated protein Cst1
MSEKYIDALIWELKEEGRKISEDVSKAINDMGFRLLEQVRLGNKDNVFYMLLRCFSANKKKFPYKLVEAFKPENDEYFKILIFSFLSSILGKEQIKGGEK